MYYISLSTIGSSSYFFVVKVIYDCWMSFLYSLIRCFSINKPAIILFSQLFCFLFQRFKIGRLVYSFWGKSTSSTDISRVPSVIP